MTGDDLDHTVLDTAVGGRSISDSLDEENRLKPGFVRRVRDALDGEEWDAVYGLVEPLHPADIADLFELLDNDERAPLARAISDLMGAEVIAETED